MTSKSAGWCTNDVDEVLDLIFADADSENEALDKEDDSEEEEKNTVDDVVDELIFPDEEIKIEKVKEVHGILSQFELESGTGAIENVHEVSNSTKDIDFAINEELGEEDLSEVEVMQKEIGEADVMQEELGEVEVSDEERGSIEVRDPTSDESSGDESSTESSGSEVHDKNESGRYRRSIRRGPRIVEEEIDVVKSLGMV